MAGHNLLCSGPAVKLLALIVCALSLVVQETEGIWLSLPAKGAKCISEEIHNNVIVLADFVVISEDYNRTPTIAVTVSSPFGSELYHNVNITHGQFAFTTHETGSYLACFSVDGNNPGGEVTVNLDWKVGVSAKDWDSVARKEKIQGVELELRKLEGAVEAVHENLIYLKSRESEMRTVSEITNSRVASYSLMSVAICISVSAWQLWHLKRYFQKKKLI